MSKVRKRNRNEYSNPLTDEEIMLMMAYPETKEQIDVMQGYVEDEGFYEWE